MLTCKIALPDSPRALIIKIRALHLAGRNEFRFFCLAVIGIFKMFFFHFWLMASVRKI